MNDVGFEILLHSVGKSSLKMLCLILANECFQTFWCSLAAQGDFFQMILGLKINVNFKIEPLFIFKNI